MRPPVVSHVTLETWLAELGHRPEPRESCRAAAARIGIRPNRLRVAARAAGYQFGPVGSKQRGLFLTGSRWNELARGAR